MEVGQFALGQAVAAEHWFVALLKLLLTFFELILCSWS